MSDFLTYGRAKGLAYEHDWQKSISGLYQREEYAAQQRAEEQNKAEHFSQILARPKNIKSEYNNKRINKDYEKRIKDIGNFVVENPGFDRDIGLSTQFNEMASGIIDNDIIREELQVEKEFELLKQNRNNLTKEKFNAERDRYLAYINQDPDAPEENRVEPYFFNSYLSNDPTSIIDKTASVIPYTQNKVTIDGAETYQSSFDSDKFNIIVETAYHISDNREILDSHFINQDDAIKEMYENNSFNWFKMQVRAREEQRYNESILQRNLKAAEDGSFTYREAPHQKYFLSNILNGNPQHASNIANIVFTPFRKKGVTQTLNALQENGGAFVSTTGEDGKSILSPFSINLNYEATSGGGRVRIIDGKTYISQTVKTSIPEDQAKIGSNLRVVNANTKEEISTLGSELEANGFKSKASIEGIGINLSFEDSRSTNIIYEGEIWVPAIINDHTLNQYDKNENVLGQEGMKSIDPNTYRKSENLVQFKEHIHKDPLFSKLIEEGEDYKIIELNNYLGVAIENPDGNYKVAQYNENGELIENDISKEQYEKGIINR